MPENQEVIDEVQTSEAILRGLVDAREIVQKQRIAFGNRLFAATKLDSVPPSVVHLMEGWKERFHGVEKEADKAIASFIKSSIDDPFVRCVMSIKGIGPIIAAKISVMVDVGRVDIEDIKPKKESPGDMIRGGPPL